MTMDPRPTLVDPDDDPFLWLEEVEGARATAWADVQSRTTMERFGNARFAADRDALHGLLDRPDNLPVPIRRGGQLYNFWKDADHQRGIWRRTTIDSYRTQAPDWDVLLDLDALAAAEGEDWSRALDFCAQDRIIDMQQIGERAAAMRRIKA